MPGVVSSGALLMHGDGGVLCSSATIPWAEAKEMANSNWGIIRKSARRVDVLLNIMYAQQKSQARLAGRTKIRIQKHPAVVQPAVFAHWNGLTDRAPEEDHPEDDAENNQAKPDEDPPIIGDAQHFASKDATTFASPN